VPLILRQAQKFQGDFSFASSKSTAKTKNYCFLKKGLLDWQRSTNREDL